VRTIQDILNTRGMQVLGVEPSATVREAVKWMVQAGVGCVIVGRPPDLLGIFTERDLAVRVVAAGRDPDTTLIQDVMSLPVRSCPPTATVADVARTFAGAGCGTWRSSTRATSWASSASATCFPPRRPPPPRCRRERVSPPGGADVPPAGPMPSRDSALDRAGAAAVASPLNVSGGDSTD